MPELCGSTTLRASKVANAASAALPPSRRISTPAAAARGSAALTIPGTLAGAEAGGAAAAAIAKAAAMSGRKRRRIDGALLGPDGLGNVGESLACHALREAVRDAPRNARPLVDHRAIELDQARACADSLPRVLRVRYAADADQRDLSPACPAEP